MKHEITPCGIARKNGADGGSVRLLSNGGSTGSGCGSRGGADDCLLTKGGFDGDRATMAAVATLGMVFPGLRRPPEPENFPATVEHVTCSVTIRWETRYRSGPGSMASALLRVSRMARNHHCDWPRPLRP